MLAKISWPARRAYSMPSSAAQRAGHKVTYLVEGLEGLPTLKVNGDG